MQLFTTESEYYMEPEPTYLYTVIRDKLFVSKVAFFQYKQCLNLNLSSSRFSLLLGGT